MYNLLDEACYKRNQYTEAGLKSMIKILRKEPSDVDELLMMHQTCKFLKQVDQAKKKNSLKAPRENSPAPIRKRRVSEVIIKSAKKLQEEIQRSVKRRKMYEENGGDTGEKGGVTRFNESFDLNEMPDQLKGRKLYTKRNVGLNTGTMDLFLNTYVPGDIFNLARLKHWKLDREEQPSDTNRLLELYKMRSYR